MIDWHINPFKAERWYGAWYPALERARGFGADSVALTRSEDDPLHFRQTTLWESRADFESYWTCDELTALRQATINWYNKPLYPTWHTLLAASS